MLSGRGGWYHDSELIGSIPDSWQALDEHWQIMAMACKFVHVLIIESVSIDNEYEYENGSIWYSYSLSFL